MRGVVRPIDIASDNTIPSTKIADSQVEFIPEGELSDAQKKGWLVRMWNSIRPMP
jgi:flagellar L-ring protein precursor FlgH